MTSAEQPDTPAADTSNNRKHVEVAPTVAQWGRLKRLSFILDEPATRSALRGPSISEPDANGVRYLIEAESSAELDELVHLAYKMNLVSPRHDWTRHTFSGEPDLATMDLDTTSLWITAIVRGDRFTDGLLNALVHQGTLQRLCRHAYSLAVTKDGWPTAYPVDGRGRIRIGTVIRSISGSIEGRTSGGRRRCTATGQNDRNGSNACAGWQIAVHWETGQRMSICSEGWHYDPELDEIQVIGGGEISARYVSPKPHGTPPLSRDQWPSRLALLQSPAWKTRPQTSA